jgi:hypothetical protein
MELYTLDSLNRRNAVVDQFQSLIWTERWQTYGDFQLNVPSTYSFRSVLKPDTWLAMSKSNYIMRIESVEDDWNDDGSRDLIIKGSSIEKLFDARASDSVPHTDTPANVARSMFHNVCVSGTWDIGDTIPGIIEGIMPGVPASNISEGVETITVTITDIVPPTLFTSMVTNICIPYSLGFRILCNSQTGQLYFDIYAGSDRTTDQTLLPAVVFAPQLDNLQNTKELTDISTAMNVAYVTDSSGATTIVYADGVDPTTMTAFERRVMIVDATNLTSPTTAQLQQAGIEALAGARTSFLFDGEISQQSQYTYGVDYFLGDLVEEQNSDGVQTQMRVTEQIFSQDSTGEKNYPTLASYESINTGTWLGWNNNKAWFDLDSDTTDVWGNQP